MYTMYTYSTYTLSSAQYVHYLQAYLFTTSVHTQGLNQLLHYSRSWANLEQADSEHLRSPSHIFCLLKLVNVGLGYMCEKG